MAIHNTRCTHKNVGFCGHLAPDLATKWLDEADVYLLVGALGMKEGVFRPSKLADYLTGCRPILALSSRPGVVADYLQNGGDIVVAPDDPAAIVQALRQLLDLKHAGRLAELPPLPATGAELAPGTVDAQYEHIFIG